MDHSCILVARRASRSFKRKSLAHPEAVLRRHTSAAGTILVKKRQVRAHAQHAPTPIRAGIAGSHPDLIPGPVLRRDQPQSRCSQPMHPTAQINPWPRKNACPERAHIPGRQMDHRTCGSGPPFCHRCWQDDSQHAMWPCWSHIGSKADPEQSLLNKLVYEYASVANSSRHRALPMAR